MSRAPRVFVVTDPMCSWCWGMAAAVEEAAHMLAGEVAFDCLLGGINLQGTQPVGDFGRRHLYRIWRDVQATTGQPFGFALPEGIVYNSTLPCIAVEAVRRRTATAPFGFLHRVQQSLFVEGRNVNDPRTLDLLGREFGWAPGELEAELGDAALKEAVREQFDSSRSYGTNALPSVLVEGGSGSGARRLLLGGFADSGLLVETIRRGLGE